MRENIVAGTVVVVVISLSVGGYFLYHAWDQHQARQALMQEIDSSSQSTQSSNSSTGASASGQQQITISGNPQTQVLSESTTNQTADNTNSSTNNASINPADFGMYSKYQSDTSALFADITTGTGTEATAGKKVSVTYAGWLTNGTLFDQTTDSSKPFAFTLGAGSVITGWEQTIPGMKVGGERLLIIPPAVGYGNTANGAIPANSVLVFRVKLVGVE